MSLARFLGKAVGLPRFWAYVGQKLVCGIQHGLGNVTHCVVILWGVFKNQAYHYPHPGIHTVHHKLAERYCNTDDRVCYNTNFSVRFFGVNISGAA